MGRDPAPSSLLTTQIRLCLRHTVPLGSLLTVQEKPLLKGTGCSKGADGPHSKGADLTLYSAVGRAVTDPQVS